MEVTNDGGERVALERHYPHWGDMETIGKYRPLKKHFADEQILEVHREPLEGKCVILQYGRGCGAACVAMIARDHGIEMDEAVVQKGQLTTLTVLIAYLKELGFTYASEKLGERREVWLAKRVSGKLGPGILQLKAESGNHWIVLDRVELEERTATLRDPYHGWMVRVQLDALLAKLNSFHYFLQAALLKD